MGKSFLSHRRTYLHSILLMTPRCQLVTLQGLLISASSPPPPDPDLNLTPASTTTSIGRGFLLL